MGAGQPGSHTGKASVTEPAQASLFTNGPVTTTAVPRLLYFVTEDWFFCSHFCARAVAAKQVGYEVYVLTRARADAETIRQQGLHLVPIELNRHGINPFAELKTLFRVARVYRQLRPTLVHHFALKPIVYGSLAAKLAGVERLINAPVGMGFIFSSRSLQARVLRPLMQLLLRWVLNPPGSRVVFENTDDFASAVRDRLVTPASAVLIRGAGVDLQRFRPGLPLSAEVRVLLVARMLWDKGVGEFVEAARMLLRRGIKAQFVLVGAPDPGNPAAVPEVLLRQWQAEGVVDWLGKRADIPALLEEARIACLPSYREGLPKSLLEALAAGRAIVTTDVEGCRDIVVPDENGLLVPPRDAVALADALESLIRDPERCQAFGQAGRRRAQAMFATELIEAQTLELYQQMLR
ncbi:MAG: glycosyltransferase family 1 protein [Halochromatium sp.]|nr:glycosyltransferase family 1 protein [Halochromatium sp.]